MNTCFTVSRPCWNNESWAALSIFFEYVPLILRTHDNINKALFKYLGPSLVGWRPSLYISLRLAWCKRPDEVAGTISVPGPEITGLCISPDQRPEAWGRCCDLFAVIHSQNKLNSHFSNSLPRTQLMQTFVRSR